MKANELQIGDWATCESKNGKVKELREHKLSLRTENSVMIVYYNSVEPIPITPEILEKNGFDISDKEVMQYHFEEDGEKYHFSLRQMYNKDGKPHGYSFYAFNVLTLLDYVHELQHALRLCGIDKEIEI